ncbi:MAG: hypothetical protein WD226_08085 [Planctomycetota bacterium]
MRVLERLRAAGLVRRWRLDTLPARLRGAAPFLAVALLLEVLGRMQGGLAVDGAACVLLVTLCLIEFTRRPEVWGPRLHVGLRQRARRWSAPFEVPFGLDLRGSPPLPLRVPRAWAWAIGVSAAVLVGLVVLSPWLPTAALSTLRDTSGALFLVTLTGLWLALALVTLSAWTGVFMWLRAEFDGREGSLGALARDVGFFLLLSTAGYAAWYGSVGVALLWLLGILVLFGLSDASVAGSKRRVFRDRDGTLAWTPFGLWVSGQMAAPLFCVMALVLLASGESLFGRATDSAMSLTSLLGAFAAWSITLSTACFQLVHLASVAAERRQDPANGFRTRLFVEGVALRNERQLFQRTVAHFGFLSRFAPRRRRREEVPLRLTEVAQPNDPWQPSPWPASVAWSELEDDRFHARLRRRDEIQRRRHLMRGLAKAFRGARRERGPQKSQTPGGTWVAPHLWSFPQLLRDDELSGSPWVGPHFRRVLPLSARAHLHRVLLALEVDVIFLEDGVDQRRFRRVLRMLFEYYDLFGRRPLEERHFTGLPGVRVVLHEFSLDAPFRSETYPEPEAEELGRGRILHIFRDRGGNEEPLQESPLGDRLPEFALGGPA